MRKIIIGDPHGCVLELKDLLYKVSITEDDLIIFTGDICDNLSIEGRNVKDTVELIMSLPNWLSVRGNHDEFFAEWLSKGKLPKPLWTNQGGRETLRSYGLKVGACIPDNVPRSHRDFFQRKLMPYYIDDDIVVVHGGLTESSVISIANNKRLSHDELHEIMWNRDKEPPPNFKEHLGDRVLIVGHSQANTVVTENFICCDSYDKLIAVIVEDKENISTVMVDKDNGPVWMHE